MKLYTGLSMLAFTLVMTILPVSVVVIYERQAKHIRRAYTYIVTTQATHVLALIQPL